MAAASTVLSIGNVTLPAASGQTAGFLALLEQLAATVPAADIVTVSASAPSLPAAPTGAGPFWLTIPDGYAGDGSIPSGYQYVVYSGTASLSGGDANTTVAGSDVTYSGPAAAVYGVGTGTVHDTSDNAVLAFSPAGSSTVSDYHVGLAGSGDVVDVDDGTTVQLTASGQNFDGTLGGQPSVSSGPETSAVTTVVSSTFRKATLLPSVPGGVDTLSSVTGRNLIFAYANSDIIADGTAVTTIVESGIPASGTVPAELGVVTLNAANSAGTENFYDQNGGNVINAGLNTGFFGVAGDSAASTINSIAGGADTVFALSGVDYTGGLAANLFFVGFAATVTVGSATSETVFGGSGGGSYTIGATNFEFVAGGGSDTLTGAAGASSVNYWGGSNENLVLTQSSGSTSGTPGNTFVAFGSNQTINAQDAVGGNRFVVVDQNQDTVAGGPVTSFSGNTTLIGSAAGNDTVGVFIDTSREAPATITIQDWQVSDVLFVGDFAHPDAAVGAEDLSAIQSFDGGGATTLSLSDGTKIVFTGSVVPTNIHTNT